MRIASIRRCKFKVSTSIILLVGGVFLTPASVSAQPAQPAKNSVSFISDVAPILKENCFACHDAKKRKGKLDMSTFESFRKGGSKEDPITPGKPDESLLIDVLTTKDNSRMPPKEAGEPLEKSKIEIIEKWIAEGAKLESSISPKAELLRELRARWKPPAPPMSYPFPVTITALAFTSDGKRLIVGGQHELTVWDVAQAKLEKRIYTRSERAHALVFLPDGKLIVAGGRPGQEGDVCVYDIQAAGPTKQGSVAVLDGVNDARVLVKRLLEADDTVLCLAVSSDGKRLASGGCDRLVNVWDISAGCTKAKLEQTIENHADWVFGVAFSPDGKHLLSCSRDKTAKIWDLVAKESLLTFPDHQNPVYGVAFKPDGKVAVSVGEDNQIRFWNSGAEGKQIRNLGGHSKAIFRVIFHPKQAILVTCSADNTVRTWDSESGKALRTLSGHTDWVYALALSPDGNLVASGSWNGEVRVWKLADGSLVNSFNASPGLQQTVVKTVPAKKR
jgi:WD40 repeat protein